YQRLLQLNDIILKACDSDPCKRFQSAKEMGEELAKLLPDEMRSQAPSFATPVISSGEPVVETNRWSIAILYKSNVQPDGQVLNLLQREITRAGCQVFIDRHLTIGVAWARQIEKKIREADAVIVLLSAASVQSE